MAAMLDACGAKPKEISVRLGMAEQYVYILRMKNDDYKYAVKEFQGLVAQRIVTSASDIDSLFNQQILPSAATLIEIRDDRFAKDADRLKAAFGFLDRARDAPKATSQQDVRQAVISFPVATMQEMRRALADDGEGSREVLEVLENIEEVSGPDSPERVDEEIEVRRL
jgi:hypothetical protein